MSTRLLEKRIQDAHNIHTARALMRAALRDLEAGRDGRRRQRYPVSMSPWPCARSSVRAMPIRLRDTGGGSAEVLTVRVNAA
jgi:hypothetical protein